MSDHPALLRDVLPLPLLVVTWYCYLRGNRTRPEELAGPAVSRCEPRANSDSADVNARKLGTEASSGMVTIALAVAR